MVGQYSEIREHLHCLSQELKKVRHMSHQAEKGETCLTKLRHVYIIGQGSSYDK